MSEKASTFYGILGNEPDILQKICKPDCPLGNMNITHFVDGEFAVSYEESIRGAHVALVQSTFPNSDNLMELLLMIDAAKRICKERCSSCPLLWLGVGIERQTSCIYRS